MTEEIRGLAREDLFTVVSEHFLTDTARYADLVLPDTTYLERFDAISLLDRPISDADAAGDGADVALSLNVVAWNSAIAGSGRRSIR